MKRALNLIIMLLLLALLGGCTKHIVRDAVVYQTEINQYDAWATKQAALLKGFMASSCTCDAEQKFTTKECRESADFVLTIEARAAWHKGMALFLAGINETRPPEELPVIPPSSSLCPAAPAPVPATEGGE